MAEFIDMTGWVMKEHGVPNSRWTVIERAEDYISPKGKRFAQWVGQCECGTIKNVDGRRLRNGRSLSCGCYRVKLAKKIYTKRNVYEEHEDYMIGFTNDGETQFKFDKEDFDKVKALTWFMNDQGYIVSTESNPEHKRYRLSRLVMNVEDKFEVDHISHNLLDNRKSNLRITTHQENLFNQQKSKNNTSGYIGVVKHDNKWVSQIMYNGKMQHLGIFDTPEKASSVYQLKAEELFGEYKYTENNN